MTALELHTREVMEAIATELGEGWVIEPPIWHQDDLPGQTIRLLIIYQPSIKHSLCIYPNAVVTDKITIRFLSQTGIFETTVFDDWASYKARLRELYKTRLCKQFQLS